MNNGLSTEEVNERIRCGQVNAQEDRMVQSDKEIWRKHILTYFNALNTILLVIVAATGEIHNAMFYFTVIINTLMGTWQEIKARNLLNQMTILHEARYKVKRDGGWTEVRSEEIVKDDLLLLEAGQQIPVDGTVQSGFLECNESMLTGEQNAVQKHADSNVFSGTVVTSGRAEVLAEKVGAERTSSAIMAEARTYKKAKSQLAGEMDKLIKIISIIIVPAGVIIFLTQFMRTGLPWRDAALNTVAAVIGMIPEGLVVLTSTAMLVSTMRLARREVLVQELYSIESLARVDTLCLDKTGTLTKGTMRVSGDLPLGGFDRSYMEKGISSLIAAFDSANATSNALRERYGTDNAYTAVDTIPFSSDRKFSAVQTQEAGCFYMGAASIILHGTDPDLLAQCSDYAKDGTRVILLAHSSDPMNMDLTASRMEPCGLFLLQDELRDNTAEIMDYFTKQDVTLKVISGDDPAAVSAIAARAGIPDADRYVDMLGHEDYDDLVDRYTVFGRVMPNQKKELILALKRKGHQVAMTGDGVNDVPALKSADVSVAMAAGAPAARDSSNFILLDNDFAKMPSIVDEGRRVVNNITRASSMYLVKTLFSVLLSIYVIILAHPYPFVPVQLTLISTCGVGIPTVILQLEPSFERITGDFLGKAFKNALPSAFLVMWSVFNCIVLQNFFSLSEERYSGILMALTGFVYMYTLIRVYKPLTKLRTAVVICMSCVLVSAIFFYGSIFDAKLTGLDLLLVGAGATLIPFMMDGLNLLFGAIGGLFRKKAPEN